MIRSLVECLACGERDVLTTKWDNGTIIHCGSCGAAHESTVSGDDGVLQHEYALVGEEES